MTIKAFNLKKINNLKNESDREVKGLIITVALFTAAVILGSGTLKHSSDFAGEYSDFFSQYLINRTNEKIYTIFFNSISLNLLLLLLINFAGLCCIGIPILILLVLLKGFGFGFFAGYLFSQFSINGIGYYLITVFPGAVITNTMLLIASNNSVFLSSDILSVSLAKKQADANLLKNYIKQNIIVIAAYIIASIIDSILIKAFGFMFVF